MGLAVTYGIIKENNGEIKVNSEIGQGATFTMTFPLAQPNG
jgi:histidine kinase